MDSYTRSEEDNGAVNILPPPSEIEGMRKVKHLTISFCNFGGDGENVPIYYAVVYIPAGYNQNTIQYTRRRTSK